MRRPPVGQVEREQMKARALYRIGRLVTFIASMVVGAYLVLFLLTGVWQVLGVAGSVLLAVPLYGRAARLAHKGDVDRAALLVWLGAAVLFPLAVLFFKGVILPLALGTLGFSLALGGIFLARRHWPAAGVITALMLIGIVMLDIWEPMPWSRFDIHGMALTQIAVYVIIALASVVTLVFLVGVYRRLANIRARITFAFVSVVLVAMLAVGILSVLVAVYSARQQVFGHLRSVLLLKRAEITEWFEKLQDDLDVSWMDPYEVDRMRVLLLEGEGSEYAFWLESREQLRLQFQRMVKASPFEELSLVDAREGRIVLSSDPNREGQYCTYETYFRRGLRGEDYVHPPFYDPVRDEFSVILARPVTERWGRVLGVLVARVDAEWLRDLVARAPTGETGESYLVTSGYRLLTGSRFGEYEYVNSEGISEAVHYRVTGEGVYRNYRGVEVLGAYTWIPKLGVALLTEIDQAEVLRGTWFTILVELGGLLGAMVVTTVVAVWIARSISMPLSELAGTATRIAAGELELEAPVRREDEIGVVARAFNRMTRRLREMIDTLERRVEERTRGLQAVAEVSRATTSVLDPDELLPQVVELVRERFDLYYVGLFLVDEERKYAVLRAGSGEAGRLMLAQGWRLEVGGASMIGQCVATGKPGVKQREGDKVVRFENPYLPETRSELALPLRYGDEVIGAMTVQSVEEEAFDEAYIAILQNMADQVAVAVQNARLFAETQAALERAQRARDRYLAQGWTSYVRRRVVTGYEQRGEQVVPLGESLLPEVQTFGVDEGRPVTKQNRLLVPVRVAGRVVGVLGFERSDGQPWREDEIVLAETLAEQLGLAAENQRLIDETRLRAARESAIREISDRMQRATSMEALMRVTAEELNRLLESSRVYVHLAVEAEAARGVVEGQQDES